MIMRVLLAAIIAGMLSGAIAGAFQVWRVTPLILAAEVYENQSGAEAAQTSVAQTGEVKQAEPWAPGEGFERSAYTLLTNIIMGVGFAFVLAAAVVFSGRTITAQNGILWGLAGFITFTLAPTTGLAPDLPGLPAADLLARQTWWVGTVIATAGGLALIAFQKHLALKALGVVLLVIPNIIGAPHPQDISSTVPAVLEGGFAANTLAMMALYWIVLGVSMGWWLNRAGTAAEA